jgi:cell division protein FtsB
MARNQKKQSSGLLLWPAVKASLLCVVIVVCCVGYVWQKKQIADLAAEIRTDEKRLDALHDNNLKLAKQLTVLQSPPALEARAQELKLGLVPAQPNQIWRLPEPGAAPVAKAAALKREPQFAAQPVRAGL